jgi:hypothetical protein
MPPGFQLGIEQATIDGQFKTASIRGHQGQALDFGFECVDQFSRQTDGAIGVMSDCTIDQLNFQQHLMRLPYFKNEPRR